MIRGATSIIISSETALQHFIHHTGIPAVDEQHRAIDNLISLYGNANGHSDEEQCLAALSRAVQSHFQFIGNYFDVKFPGEFQQRQLKILDWLSAKIRQRLADEISRQELAAALRQMFIYNFPCQAEKRQNVS